MLELSLELIFTHLMEDPRYLNCFHFLSREDQDYAEIRISGVRLMSRRITSPQKDILYFGRTTDFMSLSLDAIRPLNMVVCGSHADIHSLLRRCDGAFVWLTDAELFNCVFNDTLAFFAGIADWSAQADMVIAQHQPLQNLLNVSEALLKNPIVMWDNSFKLAMRPTFRVPELPVVQEWIDNGSIPGPYVEQFIAKGYLRRYKEFVVSSMEPRQMTDYPFELRVFLAPKHQVLVMAQYYVREPPSLAQKELLSLFGGKIEQYIASNKEVSDSNENRIYEPFLLDLIHGELGETEIRDKLKYIQIPFEDDFVLYAITIERYSKPVSTFVRKSMKTILPISHAVDDAGTIYVLSRRESSDPEDVEMRVRKVRELMQATGCRCGVSRNVHDLSAIQYAAKQCLSALAVGRIIQPEEFCWFYRDLYLFDMLMSYIQKMGGSPDCVLYPPLKELIANDLRNGSDNLRLLSVFLDHSKNITNTARDMFLHRNSVIYRIERIEKTLNASLNDPKTRLDLLLSLKALELQAHMEASAADRES